MLRVTAILGFLGTLAITGCSRPAATAPPVAPALAAEPATLAKITFDTAVIHEDGLRGPADGLVAVSYEFCIPAKDECYQQVRAIDPRIQIMQGTRGRIGCSNDQALCIGQTHQPNFRQVLQKLAALEYVTEIRECVFE
jgi:hypothetical protein